MQTATFDSAASKPFGKPFRKPFGKHFGKPFEKPFGKAFGKPLGNPFGKSFRKPFGKSFRKPFGKTLENHIYIYIWFCSTIHSAQINVETISTSVHHFLFTNTGSPFSILTGFFRITGGDGEDFEGGGVEVGG